MTIARFSIDDSGFSQWSHLAEASQSCHGTCLLLSHPAQIFPVSCFVVVVVIVFRVVVIVFSLHLTSKKASKNLQDFYLLTKFLGIFCTFLKKLKYFKLVYFLVRKCYDSKQKTLLPSLFYCAMLTFLFL